MKLSLRTLFAIFSLFFISHSVQAQSHLRRSFYGDFFGGITMSSMDMEGDNVYKKTKLGFQIGGNFNLEFAYNLQLQTGFYLIKKGSLQHEKTSEKKVDSDGFVTVKDIKYTTDANFIQVPLNIGLEIPLSRAKGLYFNAHAGVFMAYGFKGDTKGKGYEAKANLGLNNELGNLYDFINYNTSSKTFSNSNLKRWDYGLNANIGLVYDIFILQFQYDHGLNDLATEALGRKWKSRNYALSFGFRF